MSLAALAAATVIIALVAAGCGLDSATAPVSRPTQAPRPQPVLSPLCVSASVRSFTADDMDTAVESFLSTFYLAKGGKGHFKQSTTGSQAAFWQQAEMIEMVEDAYERSHDPRYRQIVAELCAGVVAHFGTRWTRNHLNDDIMWMVLADLRAYEITGNVRCRDQAKWHFDKVYARAWSRDLGGGLWWSTARDAKNACVNGPAIIAAIELSEALHDKGYLRKAQSLYRWTKNTLFDRASGAVFDRAFRAGKAVRKDHTTYTYNQGTFIGAAGLLYATTHSRVYYHDALKALAYTRTHLTVNGVIRSEGSGRDGGGFKGIFARWAARFTRDNGITAYDDWLRSNADAAWSHRNASGAMNEDWTIPTGNGRLFAFDCSSGVVILQVCPAPSAQQPVAAPTSPGPPSLPASVFAAQTLGGSLIK